MPHAQSVAPLAADYSYARPSNTELSALGLISIGRYLARDGRGLTVPERDRLWSGGYSIWLYGETDEGQMKRGAPGGRADSAFFNTLADSLSWPADRPIFYTCDTDPGYTDVDHNGRPGYDMADFPAEAAYLAACTGRPRGIYGGAGLVEAALREGYAEFGIVSNAKFWDHGYTSPRAHMHQAHYLLNKQLDAVYLLQDDWGAFHPNMPYAHPPTPPDDPMALTDIDKQFIQTEFLNQDIRTKAYVDHLFASELAGIKLQLDPIGLCPPDAEHSDDAPVLRQLVEKTYNQTRSP